MNKNKRQPYFGKRVNPSIKCNCGKTLSQKSRTNYPFGKNSKSVKTTFYKCSACGFVSY